MSEPASPTYTRDEIRAMIRDLDWDGMINMCDHIMEEMKLYEFVDLVSINKAIQFRTVELQWIDKNKTS